MSHIGPELAPQYFVHYTDSRRNGDQMEPDYQSLVPLAYRSRNAAFACAFRFIEQKAIVWRIMGPDNFLATRDEIESAYKDISGRLPPR
jgi:hypothetical protein